MLPARRPRSLCVPLVLSLAAHALLVLVLALWPSASSSARPRPVEVILTEVHLGLEEPARPRRRLGPEPGEVRIVEPVPGLPATVEGPTPPPGALRTVGHQEPDGPGAVRRQGEGGPGRPPLLAPSANAPSVVYLLDRSASMGLHGALRAARREVQAALAALPPNARFQVVPFNSTAAPLRLGGRTDLAFASPAALTEVDRLLEALPATGGTRYLAALRAGLLFRPAVLYLITDGRDLRPQDEADATVFNGGRTVIHVVEVTASHQGASTSPLAQLAARNGGSYLRLLPDDEPR